MEIFLVGGAVRDELLNRPVNEWDWVVVGATADELISQGYKQVGKDFPVFLHPETSDEYALARTERKTAAGYKGFAVHADPDVTLEQDLERRDLTINAIAKDSNGNYIDPFNGIDDIKNKIIRHVSPAFAEDPVRILRIARFLARYHHLEFKLADETLALMRDMVIAGEVDALVSERVWAEFHKALGEKSPWIFIETLRRCNALERIAPELDALFNIPQREDYHPEVDCGIHSLMSLEQACLLTDGKEVRFASLVHDLGKAQTPEDTLPSHYNHEIIGVPIVKSLCNRLHCPNDFKHLALLACEFHTKIHNAFELKPKTILKLFESTDAFRKPERFSKLLLTSMADSRGRKGFEDRPYPQKDYLEKILIAATDIDTSRFSNCDIPGNQIAEEIRKMRLSAISSMAK